MARYYGTTAERGYGTEHQRLRAQLQPQVQSGRAYCHASICLHPTRQIHPWQQWDLGHTPDRTKWTGPEHRRCNRADGARRGNRRRGLIRQAIKASRRQPSYRW